jgi:hypothetical protein
MDPQSALDAARAALAAGKFTEAKEFLRNYLEWRQRGGFEPANGDATLRELNALAYSRISTYRALQLFGEWHSGQWCPMYAVQSSRLVASWTDLLIAIRKITDTDVRAKLELWVQRAARRNVGKRKHPHDGNWYYYVRD